MPADLNDLVQGRLFDQRIVLVSGVLDAQRAAEAAVQLMTLDASGDAPVILRLTGRGTSYDTAFTLMDTIDLLGVPVLAHAGGRVEGPLVGVLAVSQHRWMSPHATIQLTEPKADHCGRFQDLERWAEEQRRLGERFTHRLAEATGRTPDQMSDDLQSGRVLDAEQAVRYGLADEVGAPRPTG